MVDSLMEIAALTEQLVNINSVTGSEAAIAAWLEEYALGLGYRVEKQAVEDGRWNLFINWQTHSPVVFCTHMDVVPPYYPARREGETIVGRGACDTKGIIASMLKAGEALAAAGEFPSYLFTVGEEVDSCGAKKAAESGRTAGYIVVGEPTKNILIRGHKGVLGYTICTYGKRAHSAFPEAGLNAIDLLLDILFDIRCADWGSDELLGSATTNIGKLEGGIAANVIPESAEATVLHRIVDDPEHRLEQVRRLVGERGSLEVFSKGAPQLMHVPAEYISEVVSFGTDIPYLRPLGMPLLVGPGDILDAHTDHEKINISELHDAVRLYVELYHRLKESLDA
jgi:acetylornithine deacetylase